MIKRFIYFVPISTSVVVERGREESDTGSTDHDINTEVTHILIEKKIFTFPRKLQNFSFLLTVSVYQRHRNAGIPYPETIQGNFLA